MSSLLRTRCPRLRPGSGLPRSARWRGPDAPLAPVALLVALSVASGCGGKAVVDGSNDGAGGSGGSDGDGGAGICVTPDPVGPVTICNTGMTTNGCYIEACDSSDQRWRATCTQTGCSCVHSPSEQVCSCIGLDPEGFCNGTAHSCCPAPFP